MRSLDLENTWIVATVNSGMLAIALLSFCVASTIPSSVAADPVGPLNTFLNDTPADAVEVNENFEGIKTAVDDNYDRAVVAQQTADGAASGHTVDTNTQLSEAQVDGFAGNNGYAFETDVQMVGISSPTN